MPDNSPPQKTQIDNCTIQYKYEINSNHKISKLYIKSVPRKDYSEYWFYVYAILKKDGNYTKIDVFDDPNKKTNLQYYEFYGFSSEIVGERYTAKFYDKNIYYLDKIEFILNENIC